jgi:putative nucleotidyltransferase with HDIG domain
MTMPAPIPDRPSWQNLLVAIVLAAGESSRMGRLKPLLPLAGIPALERAITVFHEAGVEDVLVVLGNRAAELRPLAERGGACCIDNPNFAEGMYSSVVAGARALPPSTRAAFVLPADVPLVRAATIRQLVDASLASPASILYPVFEHRRGHPPLIARAILDHAARGEPGPLCTLLAAHESGAIEVPVADEAVHLDMDTPPDFDRLQTLAMHRDIPTTAECEAMLEQHRVPETRRSHSRRVAELAGKFAEALVATGLAVDPELARAGGLLHDIAKGQPKHAETGAAIVRDYGMPRLAAIVAAHMKMDFTGTVDERAIVYLADKLVAGDQRVTLDERFRLALLRFRDNREAREGAQRRKAVAEQIATAIEARVGTPLDAIAAEVAP